MTIFRRRLHSQALGGVDEDAWCLVFDTQSKQLFVAHEWGHVDADRKRGDPAATVELELTSYLALGREGPGQRELERLIKTLFDRP